MVTEHRLLNSTSERTGEIILKASVDKLIERLLHDDAYSIIDPTYIQDFLLTYRVFIDNPTYISSKLFEWFKQGMVVMSVSHLAQHHSFHSSRSSSSSSLNSLINSNNNNNNINKNGNNAISAINNNSNNNSANTKRKVYRIILEWITNHFNDFESNRELYEFIERFQEILKEEKMYDQLRVLTIAISTKSKPRAVTLARSKRDESLMFNVQGGWDKGYGIFVYRVDKDSKANELGIRRGDQILEVNGQSFQHIAYTQALDTLKSFTHLSITLKYNPIGFNEMLLHPDKSPHRNKKNLLNNQNSQNRAYLIQYMQMQGYQTAAAAAESTSLASSSNSRLQAPMSPAMSNSNSLLSQLKGNSSGSQLKGIGSIPPLPPSSLNKANDANYTPRSKSKESKTLLENFIGSSNVNSLFKSNTSLNSANQASQPQQPKTSHRFRKAFEKLNRNLKPYSKDLASITQVDSSAPALKSITRSPSPSLAAAYNSINRTNAHTSNNTATTSANLSVPITVTTTDYTQTNQTSSLSRNNSVGNLNELNNTAANVTPNHLSAESAVAASLSASLASINLQDQQQFACEQVLKIYKNDQTFKYLVVHKETSTKEVVMLALNEFNIIDDIGSKFVFYFLIRLFILHPFILYNYFI
jgi:hypothetical protein